MPWREAKWTIWLTLVGAALMFALVAWFYAADHKESALRVIVAVSPATKMLPRLTENWRLNTVNIRLFDGLVVLTASVEGLAIGAAIDIVRFLHRQRR
jgi:hypothetical protein